MSHPLVSIIVPTHNKRRTLRECLLSIRKTAYRNFETIVVDAASTDGTAEMVHQEFPEVKLVRAGNIWHGEAQNTGIINSRGELVASLEDDYIFEPKWLETLVATILRSEKIGVVGGTVYFYENRNHILSAGGRINKLTGDTPPFWKKTVTLSKERVASEVDYVPVILTRRKTYYEVGLWDPEYQLLFDETDFCYRAKRHGYEIVYVPNSVLWHNVGRGGLDSPPKRIYFFFRNRVRFIIKNFPFPYMFTALFYNMSQMIMLIVLYSTRRKKSHVMALFRATMWNAINLRKTMSARAFQSPSLTANARSEVEKHFVL